MLKKLNLWKLLLLKLFNANQATNKKNNLADLIDNNNVN